MGNKTITKIDLNDEAIKNLISFIKNNMKEFIDDNYLIDNIEIMCNRDSNWVKPSQFVYKLRETCFSSMRGLLMKELEVTGYKKSRINDFCTAGRKLASHWDGNETLPKELIVYIRPKDKLTNDLIKSIKKIGEYVYSMDKFIIYSGETEKDNKKYPVYFKTTNELDAAIVEIKIAQKTDTDKTETHYVCGGKNVDLYDFEPCKTDYIKIKTKRE